MRRRIVEEPYSAMALWSRRFALLAFLLAGLGILASRYGLDVRSFHIKGLDLRMVFVVLAAAVFSACLALISSFIAMAIIWRTGRKGLGAMFAGFFLSLLLLAYPAYLASLAWRLPALSDISTDLADPPAFSMSAKALAARRQTTPAIPSEAERQLQKSFYPEIEPVLLDSDAQAAYRSVRQAAAAMGWRIVEAVPPSGRNAGHIDAIARGRILGFPNDITIRIQPLGAETRIDMRSVSTLLPHDFGANARRIQQFMTTLQGDEE
ncbi:DUF1499 domain-containing protein [Beijerinckia indica]|uniref:DUF1499 domain-containing protein n=1 Tax=Beijerinckia indica subsp. indica (strain ATCC 9039 / DSM 1715 / NCIMB 8712) TaxID=395963 RepID=B2II12_BEII9|nr:DUF1499 domain-containing protein [Beijerinckia indica]ACB94595.1 conserved hypothetical protein [Beijerinckia indica subsp. indica ATCC 9039]